MPRPGSGCWPGQPLRWLRPCPESGGPPAVGTLGACRGGVDKAPEGRAGGVRAAVSAGGDVAEYRPVPTTRLLSNRAAYALGARQQAMCTRSPPWNRTPPLPFVSERPQTAHFLIPFVRAAASRARCRLRQLRWMTRPASSERVLSETALEQTGQIDVGHCRWIGRPSSSRTQPLPGPSRCPQAKARGLSCAMGRSQYSLRREDQEIRGRRLRGLTAQARPYELCTMTSQRRNSLQAGQSASSVPVGRQVPKYHGLYG
jgi:hypothetical protein